MNNLGPVLLVIVVGSFVLGVVTGTILATPKKEEIKAKVVDTCFPKGVLVKSENMGYICIDPGAIRWDD